MFFMLFRLSEVNKSYAGFEVLRGVSFQVNSGEKVGLVGRNGAGKTTLFRLINGAENPDEGEVIKAGSLKLGMLDQHVDFSKDETVHTASLSAFSHIHDIESEMRRLELEMATDHSQQILDRYADLQTAFEKAGGYVYAAKAESLLMGLGFGKDKWDQATASLSGGQKNRLGLVRLLLSQPDVLLLDEPTNHLDVSSVEWLESFLCDYEGAFVIISHDRYFLDRVCNRIIELENGKAFSYPGNYSEYLIKREERMEIQRRAYENQQSLISKNEEFIRKNLAGQKTKQAKSRRNMLERLERVEAVGSDSAAGNFELRGVERTGNQVLKVEHLNIGYGQQALAENIEFSLLRGEFLGVIGANGTGKTTLLKTLLGKAPQLSGQILWGTKVQTGYYSQQLDDLDNRNDVIKELRRVAPNADNGELRSFLAKFLFFGEDVFKLVGDLSGGEKGRLALAKLIYSKVNVLILDEPTNHLDIPAREALESALENYPGTIIAVSHDRYFLDRLATQIISFKEDRSVDIYDGNYTQFHQWQEKQASIKSAAPKNIKSDDEPIIQNDAVRPPASKLSKNQRQQIERRIAELESQIPRLEDQLAQLSLQMHQPENAEDIDKFQDISHRYAQIETDIQSNLDEWERLATELES